MGRRMSVRKDGREGAEGEREGGYITLFNVALAGFQAKIE